MQSAGVLVIGLILGSVLGAGSTLIVLDPVSQSDFTELSEKVQLLESSLSNFDTIEEDMKSIEDDLEVLQYKVTIDEIDLDELKAYSLMRKELGNPSIGLKQRIVNNIFSWVSGDSDADDWLSKASEDIIKQTISTTIDSKVGKLVWYEHDTQFLNENTIIVYMKTDIPLTLETGIPIIGTITFTRYPIYVKATVNTSSDTISDIEIL